MFGRQKPLDDKKYNLLAGENNDSAKTLKAPKKTLGQFFASICNSKAATGEPKADQVVQQRPVQKR